MGSSLAAALLRRPGFARYFTVVALSRATGTIFNVAGVLLILERTHDLALAGIVVAAGTLPAAFSGPFLGGWLDVARSRRRLLVLDRLITAVALAGILLLTGHAPDWVLPLVAALYGITSPLSAGAFSAVLPEVAGPELLGIANAFEAASFNAAFIIGPALAGVIAATAGPAAALEVQIAACLLLAGAIATDATFELRPEGGEAPPESVLEAVREGVRSIWRITALRWNTVIDSFYVFAWGTLYVGFPAYAVAVGAGAHASGYLWAAISAGSMVSGFALGRRASGRAPRLLLAGSFLVMSASAAAWPLAGSLALALALTFVTGLCDGPALVALISIRQRISPPRLRAQIFTSAVSLHSAVVAAGSAGAGLFHRAFGTTATLLGFAAVIALAGALSLLTDSDGERSGAAGAPAEELAAQTGRPVVPIE